MGASKTNKMNEKIKALEEMFSDIKENNPDKDHIIISSMMLKSVGAHLEPHNVNKWFERKNIRYRLKETSRDPYKYWLRWF